MAIRPVDDTSHHDGVGLIPDAARGSVALRPEHTGASPCSGCRTGSAEPPFKTCARCRTRTKRAAQAGRDRYPERQRAQDKLLRYLGRSARNVRRWRNGTSLTHLDLVHEGWLSWKQTRGTDTQRHAIAKNRMNTCAARERRQSEQTYEVDTSPSLRRLTPGDWRALHAWCARVLTGTELKVMRLLFVGRSIEEVPRELGISHKYAHNLRSRAIGRLTASLEDIWAA